MINDIYDKTSKISFSVYKDDFLEYFGEYKKIIRELGTEVETLYGKHGRLDRLILVDDDTLQDWEFQYKNLNENRLKIFWRYGNQKSAQTGKITDCFVIFFDNPEKCQEKVQIGRSIQFAPIIKYLQKMGLPKRLNTIEKKVISNKVISIHDELTLILVSLSVPDKSKEKMVKRVCEVLDKIDYIVPFRRVVIDSLIAFQIKNFVENKKEQEKLNGVVNMQLSVEELFIDVEREAEYDKGFEDGFDEGRSEGIAKGIAEGKNDIILKMLQKSVDEKTIQEFTGCSIQHISELKNKYFPSK